MTITKAMHSCRQGVPSLILGAIDAEMAPPRTRFDRPWKGLRPVGLTTNPLVNALPAIVHEVADGA